MNYNFQLHPPQGLILFWDAACRETRRSVFYRAPLDETYCAAFREIVRDAFADQAGKDSKVELVFNRIYLWGSTGEVGADP